MLLLMRKADYFIQIFNIFFLQIHVFNVRETCFHRYQKLLKLFVQNYSCINIDFANLEKYNLLKKVFSIKDKKILNFLKTNILISIRRNLYLFGSQSHLGTKINQHNTKIYFKEKIQSIFLMKLHF